MIKQTETLAFENGRLTQELKVKDEIIDRLSQELKYLEDSLKSKDGNIMDDSL
jgi:hypothetical protein